MSWFKNKKAALPLPPPNLKLTWQEVPGGMERIELQHGWIYRDYIGGHSITLCFVPFPQKEEK
jgi:hypothetical protein